MSIKSNVRVRFAPSPTGHLHVGSVRVAIFNWLYARHHGGTYLLRIENTDLERSKQEYVDSQLASLKWLSLMPDEPPVYQLDRLAEHKKALEELIERNFTYPCFCKPVSAGKKNYDNKKSGPSSYDGTCRDTTWSTDDLSRPHAIRFRLPKDQGPITFDDAIRGKITVDPDQLDDFIIVRRDGTPVYNFVVVLDDIEMEITDVIRGEDHISNTPKQLLLYHALNKTAPRFAHLPLILGTEGQRLSKRDAAVSVQEYRKEGFISDALFNYLVRLGWSHGDQEIFTKDELIKLFSLDAVGKKGSIFDLKKLSWLNGVYIREATVRQLLSAAREMDPMYYEDVIKSWPEAMLLRLIALYQQRATTLRELFDGIIDLAKDPKSLDVSLIKKWHKPQTFDAIVAYIKAIEDLDTFGHDPLLDAAKQVAQTHELKLVGIAQPLRLAIVGGVVSPGIFELMELVGKEITLPRLEALKAVLHRTER